MAITRREILWGVGGGLVGLAATPIPWKLLDDVSIWTQHQRSLPIPPGGEVTFRPTSCTLCPAGCALRVRCIGPRPVAVVSERHPLGGGICPVGLTLHHLAYHPLRLTQPARRTGSGAWEPTSLDAALATVAHAVAAAANERRTVMVIDARPGRVTSLAYRQWLGGLPISAYVNPAGEGATLAELAASSEQGIDLERTRTLLSFGAPVLDGWGRPGRMLARRADLRVVQLDAWRSPTAALADEWLAVRPGSEGVLALALAHVLWREKRVVTPAAAVSAVSAFPPARVAQRTGLSVERIEALARALVSDGPTVAVGGGDPARGPLAPDAERAIALLNVVLGAVGRSGGILPRPALPMPSASSVLAPSVALADVAERSVAVLLLDAADSGCALPWAAVERTLAPGALVVSLSPFRTHLARQARLVIPAPVPLETYDEVLPTADATAASYALALPILKRPEGTTEPLAVITRLAADRGITLASAALLEDELKRRVVTIHAARRGTVYARQEQGFDAVQVAGADQMWDVLAKGGCWVDDAAARPVPLATVPAPSLAALEHTLAEPSGPIELDWVATASRASVGTTPLSPLMTKLYSESDLRPSDAVAQVHPETARHLGLVEGCRVRVASAGGAVEAHLRFDPLLPAGCVALAVGPEGLTPVSRDAQGETGTLRLAVVKADGTWNGTRVKLQEI